MADKNRDFLPPEMMDTLRLSSDKMVKLLFTNQLSRTGNLTMSAADCGFILGNKKSKWGAALIADTDTKAKVTVSNLVHCSCYCCFQSFVLVSIIFVSISLSSHSAFSYHSACFRQTKEVR